MIECDDIGAHIGGRWLWRDLSLRFAAGECVAVLGPNGVGKSTLFRAMLGLRPVDEGEIRRCGAIGYVPQKSAITMDFTVAEIVAMARSARKGLFSGLKHEDWNKVDEALELAGMSSFADRSYQKLSGGERQMVLLARALASDAGLLILDEPCASLDLDRQTLVLGLLDRLARSRGLTILFSTHNPDHAFAIADRALLLLRETGAIAGNTDDVLTVENLSQLYSIPVSIHEGGTAGRRHRNMLVSYER